MITRLAWPDPAARDRLVQLLADGEVVILPTDTLYGFSARAGSQPALERIAALKGRDAGRSFVGLAASAGDALADATLERRAAKFLMDVWPAPLTAVLRRTAPVAWGEARDGVPTVAYRVPAYPPLAGLLAALGEPIVSTSVNRAGQAPLADAASIVREFGAAVAAIVVDPGLEARPKVASTLADFTVWPPRILRAGAFDLAAALAAWRAA